MNDLAHLEMYEDIINMYKQMINKYNYELILEEMYKYIKSISNFYYKNNYMDEYNYIIKETLINILDTLPNEKIIDYKINEYNLDEAGIIEKIIFNVRKHLLKIYKMGLNVKLDFNNIDLTNYCKVACEYTEKICKKNKIKNYSLSIYPGFNSKISLYNGIGFHYFNVIKYENDYYLIDTTYSQFFYKKYNILEKLGTLELSGCDVGIFMLMDEERKKVATTLLKQNYIKLDENIFKSYLDGFSISFRNGLYYESTNDFSYTTSYKIDDYIKFFLKEDNQINHEGIKYLGLQKYPLNDYTINFKRR